MSRDSPSNPSQQSQETTESSLITPSLSHNCTMSPIKDPSKTDENENTQDIHRTIAQINIDSGSEEEEEVSDEEDANEPLPVEYPGTILPDNNQQQIESDKDLASQYPADSEYIDLIHLKISSLEDLNLERFTNLQSLNLRQNLIDSITAVNTLPSTVEELDLYDNRINHISSSIKHLINLKDLDFSFNKIKTIKNIETLTNLENLYFVQNKIKVVQNLETLQKLTNLELGGNKIEVISETFHSLVNLEKLWLGKNKIQKFENLDYLSNLKVLSIQSNRLTKIEGLDKLVNLTELYLSHNGIEKIENLEKNVNLEVLDVTSNRLEHLDNLTHLTKLTDFWCSYNKISSFEEIGKQLGKLPELDVVYFEGNLVQLQNPTAYRRKLKLYLGPSLTKIDATYIQ